MAGAALVAVVDGVSVEVVVLAPPNPAKSDPPAGAAAGVEDWPAEVVPPRVGKGDFWGVADEAAGAPREGCGADAVLAGVVEAPPREGNGDFAAESPPAEGILNREDAPVEAGAAAPKAGLGGLSEVVAGVVDSAGLGVLANRLEPPAAGVVDGAPPKMGLLAVAPVLGANSPPDD